MCFVCALNVLWSQQEAAAGGDHGISVDQKKQLLGGINSVPFHPISQLLRSLVWLCVCVCLYVTKWLLMELPLAWQLSPCLGSLGPELSYTPTLIVCRVTM